MAELLAGWRREYAAVIIDTSPLGAVADGLAACALADGVLLVVRDRLVTRAALARSLDRLKPLGERVLGLIVNGEQANGTTGYGYGYGEGDGGSPSPGIATATRKFLRLKPGGDKPA
jgi:non-specific protein-tyrosine kinase